MSDPELRALERRWKETGAASDEANLLRERLRLGRVSPGRLSLAAFCGNGAAAVALGRAALPMRRDLGTFVATVSQLAGREAAVEAAVIALGVAASGEVLEEVETALRAADHWARAADRAKIEDALAATCPTRAQLLEATRTMAPIAAAALMLRAALSPPDCTERDRASHTEAWCTQSLGFAVDAIAGEGRVRSNPRRPLPEPLLHKLCAELAHWALAEETP